MAKCETLAVLDNTALVSASAFVNESSTAHKSVCAVRHVAFRPLRTSIYPRSSELYGNCKPEENVMANIPFQFFGFSGHRQKLIGSFTHVYYLL